MWEIKQLPNKYGYKEQGSHFNIRNPLFNIRYSTYLS